MRLLVPKEKDARFASELFETISKNIEDLAQENLKLPRKMIFSGSLGREALMFIKDNGWNFEGFSLERSNEMTNSIVFKYDAPLTQTNDPNSVIFEEGSLHGKIINGIPGESAVRTIVSSYASPNFKVEKTVRPERRVSLTRR
jgi:hypothetical protein